MRAFEIENWMDKKIRRAGWRKNDCIVFNKDKKQWETDSGISSFLNLEGLWTENDWEEYDEYKEFFEAVMGKKIKWVSGKGAKGGEGGEGGVVDKVYGNGFFHFKDSLGYHEVQVYDGFEEKGRGHWEIVKEKVILYRYTLLKNNGKISQTDWTNDSEGIFDSGNKVVLKETKEIEI